MGISCHGAGLLGIGRAAERARVTGDLDQSRASGIVVAPCEPGAQDHGDDREQNGWPQIPSHVNSCWGGAVHVSSLRRS